MTPANVQKVKGFTLSLVIGDPSPCLKSNPVDSQRGRVEPADLPPAFIARFWSKVNKTESCWLWAGKCRTRFGHGMTPLPRVGGKIRLRYVHRLSWHITRGAIPDNLQVLHRCDVPLCVNPNHLFLGTQADNMRDAWQKGRLRLNGPRRRGALGLEERLAIQREPYRRGLCVELARKYGVSKTCITLTRQGRFAGADREVPQNPLDAVFERVPMPRWVSLPLVGDLHGGQSPIPQIGRSTELLSEGSRC